MRILLLLSALLTALAGAGPVPAAPAARAHQAVAALEARAAPSRAAIHRPSAVAAFRLSLVVGNTIAVTPPPAPRVPLYAERLRV